MNPPCEPTPAVGTPDPPADSSRRRLGLGLAVIVVAGLALLISVGTDRVDTALLYVGVPCLLAVGIGLLPTRGFGVVFQVVTVLLLLASALLQEGAVCVLLASPLVYAVAGLGYGLTRVGGSGERRHLLVAPLLLAAALEGVWPGARVAPVQRAEATRTTAADCADFRSALERGPAPRPEDRGWLLRTSGYPSPLSARGEGIGPGDRWELGFVAGHVVTEVSGAAGSLVGTRSGRLTFTVVEDTSKTARSVALHRGTLTWAPEPGDPGRCRTHLVLDYERKLDPSLWFGPITAAFMDRGAETFLRALD